MEYECEPECIREQAFEWLRADDPENAMQADLARMVRQALDVLKAAGFDDEGQPMTDTLFDPFEAMTAGLSQDAQASMTVLAQEAGRVAQNLLPLKTGYSLPHWEVKSLRIYAYHEERWGYWMLSFWFRVSPFRTAERGLSVLQTIAADRPDNSTPVYSHKVNAVLSIADLYFEDLLARLPGKRTEELRGRIIKQLALEVLASYTPIMHTDPADSACG